MGRGRQKAKHTKVARELKYFSPEVDLTALERELGHADENELVDKWADLFPDEEDEEGEAGTEPQDAAVDSEDADSAADQEEIQGDNQAQESGEND